MSSSVENIQVKLIDRPLLTVGIAKRTVLSYEKHESNFPRINKQCRGQGMRNICDALKLNVRQYHSRKVDKQTTCNLTLRRVRATIVVVEKH